MKPMELAWIFRDYLTFMNFEKPNDEPALKPYEPLPTKERDVEKRNGMASLCE